MRAATPPTERLFTANFFLLWLTTFTAFASFHILLPILPLYVVNVGGSQSQIGFIIGVLTFTAVIARPWAGMEADRRGKKRILIWGTIGLLVSTFSYTLATSVGLLILLRLLQGVAWAATITPANALVADITPDRKRGEAMGYYGTAANLSMAVAPLLDVAMFNAFGFNPSFLAASTMVLLSLVAMAPIREPRLTVILQEPSFQPIAPNSLAHRSLIYGPAIFPALIALSMTMTYGGVVSFAPLLASHHNVNPGIFFAVYAGLLVIGRPLGGRFADVAGRAATIIPGMASLALALALLAFASDIPHFIAAGALYGIGFSLLQPSLMAMILDRAAAASRGAAMGTFGAAYELGIGMGSILLGLLLERTSFTVLFLVASGIAISGLITFTIGARKT